MALVDLCPRGYPRRLSPSEVICQMRQAIADGTPWSEALLGSKEERQHNLKPVAGAAPYGSVRQS